MGDDIIFLKTPAKINLTLAVLGKRPDGFHEIESWVVPIGLYDELRFSPAPELELVVQGAGGALPADSSNLAWKAAAALAAAAGIGVGVHIELRKSIHIGAGLGGGSSDAAAALRGLSNLWGLNWPIEKFMPIAASLGSDVPFFLQPYQAILRGRGERIEPVQAPCKGWAALIVPPYGLSTAAVYKRHAAKGGHRRRTLSPWLNGAREGGTVMRQLFNDLEPAAFACEPRLARLHAKLDGLEGHPVRMTGSGSGLFCIFDSQDSAQGWSEMAREVLILGESIQVVPIL